MELPSWLIQGALFGVVGFCFRVIFGLIAKNEAKSDAADLRLERADEKTEEKFRANDYTLFNEMAEVKARISSLEAKIECIQGR